MGFGGHTRPRPSEVGRGDLAQRKGKAALRGEDARGGGFSATPPTSGKAYHDLSQERRRDLGQTSGRT